MLNHGNHFPVQGTRSIAVFRFTEADRQAIAEADEWNKHNQPIPLKSVLADFDLTMSDWEAMGRTPLAPDPALRNG